jgi:hypothetical protein
MMAMLLSIVGIGMVMGLFAIAQRAAKEAEERANYDLALEVAEIGLNRAIGTLRAQADSITGWDTSGSVALTGQAHGIPYTVRVRSAYWAYTNDAAANAGFLRDITSTRGDASSEDYDLFEITAVTNHVGQYDFRRGVRKVVEMKKSSLVAEIPAPLYIDGDPFARIQGSALVSGEDHAMRKTADSIYDMPYDGTLSMQYEGSSAGLTSGFFMIDPDGNEVEIFASNEPDAQYDDVDMVFSEGQALTFFSRTYADSWGLGTYDHYAEESDPVTGKPWCEREVLEETEVNGQRIKKVKYSFEDLPGHRADWDYNDIEIVVWIKEETCATCGGTGKITCTTCSGSGIDPDRSNKDCPTCSGNGWVDCPDCYHDETTEWDEMPEPDLLTGEPGKPAVAHAPTEYDPTADPESQTFNADDYDSDYAKEGLYVNVTDPGQNTASWDEDTQYDAMTIDGGSFVDSDHNLNAIRTGDGFDLEALHAEGKTRDDRALDWGRDAFSQSDIDLRAMAAELVGGSADALPGDTDAGGAVVPVKSGVNDYTSIGNGSNVNDFGDFEDFDVTYLDVRGSGSGKETLAGQLQGGGVLVVNGDLDITGQMSFAGVVIVLGDVNITGGGNGSHILGSLLVEGDVKMTGTADILWSQEAVEKAQEAASYTGEYRFVGDVTRSFDKADIESMTWAPQGTGAD